MRRAVLMVLLLCLLGSAAMAETVPGRTVNGMLQRSLDMIGSDYMQSMSRIGGFSVSQADVREEALLVAGGTTLRLSGRFC